MAKPLDIAWPWLQDFLLFPIFKTKLNNEINLVPAFILINDINSTQPRKKKIHLALNSDSSDKPSSMQMEMA